MDNKTLENFVNQRKGNDSELSNFAKVGLKDYIFVRLDNEYTLSEDI